MSSPLRQRPFLAAYCILRRSDDILVMQRQNTGYADGEWSVPAGHVDVGESLTVAASRELEEETGLIVPPQNWRMLCAMHRWTPERECMEMFLVADAFMGTLQNREPHKCGGLDFRPLRDLPRPFLAYIETAIRAIEASGWRASVYLELGWDAVNG